jgi:hypothetical protein
VAARVGELISGCWNDETGCVGPVSGGFGAGEGAGGENCCGDVAVACQCAGSLGCLGVVLDFVGALDITYNNVGVSEVWVMIIFVFE